MQERIEARPVRRDEIATLSHVFARAFRSDPFHRWIFESDRDWERRSHRSWALTLRWQLRHGHALTTPGLEGVATWEPPRRGPHSRFARLWMGVAMVPILRRSYFPVARVVQGLEQLHPQQPYWYLGAIGTDPPHQGKGVGSALMSPVLTRCDAEGVPAYLEASRIENVPYYERHGFEVAGETTAPENGPTVYRMLRKPRV